ncbi:DUF5610 domain-containing protein [Thalassotalea sp. PLHSN55]|uniref:DUF5610 domain-containing protein n=1 Tax=Thalassotalea sp. PLHSN55 TaxID=3435888 RepID=UPI003F87FBBB
MTSPIQASNSTQANNSTQASNAVSASNSTLANASDKTAANADNQQSESLAVSQKKQLNAAIIESTLKFSHSESSEGLALMLKTALEGINEALGEAGIETSGEKSVYDAGIDFSPEATAERIVAFSTKFISAYQAQHPDMSEQDSVSTFVDIITGGIDTGFSEAKEVLGGLNVLEGEIADNIGKTYALVQQGLQAFSQSFIQSEQNE